MRRSGKNRSKTPTSSVSGEFEWDVFISYCRKDAETAALIQGALEKHGLRVWRDVDQVRPSEVFAKAIERGLDNSASVAVLVSPESMASNWVMEEYYRALSLTKTAEKPTQLIPVLLREAQLPGFLASRNWVDFRDPAVFAESVKRLVGAISGKPPTPVPAQQVAVAAVRFMWFFPEGLSLPIYSRLAQRKKGAGQQAQQQGLISIVQHDGVPLAGAPPERLGELRSSIQNEAKEGRELFQLLAQIYGAGNPFGQVVQLGLGRALLLRDQTRLAGFLRPEVEGERQARITACQLARALLSKVIEEGLLRIGLEISTTLLALSDFAAATDRLTHARLLLGIGQAERAMDVFDVYRGIDLFADTGLDDLGRLDVAVDWAKAAKEAGRARAMHSELLQAYGQMLELAGHLKAQGGEAPALDLRRADILNNRATQLGEFGAEAEWGQAREDLNEAAGIYQGLGDRRSLIRCRANFAALVLDKWQPGSDQAPLVEQTTALAALEGDANQVPAGEDLFFFYYQRGRLLRQLHPGDVERAAKWFDTASQVAEQAALPYQGALARRWVLRLRHQGELIAEDAYLQGLRECAASLRAYTENSWAGNSLREILVDIARVLGNRGDVEGAWTALAEAFEVQARRFERGRSSAAKERFRTILSLMSKLRVQEDHRTSFLNEQKVTLGLILEVPRWQRMAWENVSDWLKK